MLTRIRLLNGFASTTPLEALGGNLDYVAFLLNQTWGRVRQRWRRWLDGLRARIDYCSVIKQQCAFNDSIRLCWLKVGSLPEKGT